MLHALTLISRASYSSTLKMEAISSSETSIDFNRLHGVISQRIELFKLFCYKSLTSFLNLSVHQF
jgi:hypothetical protein